MQGWQGMYTGCFKSGWGMQGLQGVQPRGLKSEMRRQVRVCKDGRGYRLGFRVVNSGYRLESFSQQHLDWIASDSFYCCPALLLYLRPHLLSLPCPTLHALTGPQCSCGWSGAVMSWGACALHLFSLKYPLPLPSPCVPRPARPTVVSDAAAGGQVLMCSETFRSVQHMCEELGCVDHNGMNITRLNAQRAPWWILG